MPIPPAKKKIFLMQTPPPPPPPPQKKKNSNKTFPVVRCYSWKLELVLDILRLIVEKVKENQEKFRLNLSEITRWKWEHKPKELKKTINSHKTYKAWEKVIALFDDYTTILSKTKYEAKHGKGRKILTPKQMTERLPIAHAQVKARKKSKNLVGKIRKTMYYLYRIK